MNRAPLVVQRPCGKRRQQSLRGGRSGFVRVITRVGVTTAAIASDAQTHVALPRIDTRVCLVVFCEFLHQDLYLTDQNAFEVFHHFLQHPFRKPWRQCNPKDSGMVTTDLEVSGVASQNCQELPANGTA